MATVRNGLGIDVVTIEMCTTRDVLFCGHCSGCITRAVAVVCGRMRVWDAGMCVQLGLDVQNIRIQTAEQHAKQVKARLELQCRADADGARPQLLARRVLFGVYRDSDRPKTEEEKRAAALPGGPESAEQVWMRYGPHALAQQGEAAETIMYPGEVIPRSLPHQVRVKGNIAGHLNPRPLQEGIDVACPQMMDMFKIPGGEGYLTVSEKLELLRPAKEVADYTGSFLGHGPHPAVVAAEQAQELARQAEEGNKEEEEDSDEEDEEVQLWPIEERPTQPYARPQKGAPGATGTLNPTGKRARDGDAKGDSETTADARKRAPKAAKGGELPRTDKYSTCTKKRCEAALRKLGGLVAKEGFECNTDAPVPLGIKVPTGQKALAARYFEDGKPSRALMVMALDECEWDPAADGDNWETSAMDWLKTHFEKNERRGERGKGGKGTNTKGAAQVKAATATAVRSTHARGARVVRGTHARTRRCGRVWRTGPPCARWHGARH